MIVQTIENCLLKWTENSPGILLIISTAFVSILLFICPESLFAAEIKTIENDAVIVQYEQSLQNVAEEIVRIYSPVRRELEETFRFKADFQPKVIVMKDRKSFRKMTGNDLVVAIAISRKNMIVIDNTKMKTHPFTLRITLKHELCHLMLHHYTAGGMLPKWLNEGISQWVTGGISEMLLGENRDMLRRAVLSGRLIPIEHLANRFPKDIESIHLAYQESLSFLEYIVSQKGLDGVLKILNYLRDGKSVNAAIEKTVSISADELENRWHDHLRTRYTWFVYVSSHIYQILFSFAAVALTVAFIRLIIRKKAYRDEIDEDESDID